MEVELLSLDLGIAISLLFGEEVERYKKDKVSQLWEEKLDYIGEGRISIFTLRGPALYGHKRTKNG
jgi:hypothetical protein